MKSNKLLIYLGLSFAIVIYFAAAEFHFDKKMHIETDFSKTQPYAGMLYPPENVNKSLIAKTPVYFKVHLPEYYDRVRVIVEDDNPASVQLGLGVVTGAQIQIAPIGDKEMTIPLPRQDELKFVIASRPDSFDKPVVIKNFKLEFERDHLDLIGYLEIWAKGIRQIL